MDVNMQVPLSSELDTWQVVFVDQAQEHNYRQYYLKQDLSYVYVVVTVFMVSLPYLTYVDYTLFGISTMFAGLVSMRIMLILATIVGIKSLNKVEEEQKFDRLILFFTIIFLVLVLIINSTRRSGHFQYFFLDIVIVFALYVLIPNQFLWQAATAVAFSTMHLFIAFVLHGPILTSTVTAVAITFITTNALGLFSSRQLHFSRRREFALRCAEKETNAQLQTALANVKLLKELLPICANCKKIRDDEGYWQEVEVYIRDHSNTEFSHSICPNCLVSLYPEIYGQDQLV